MIYWPRVLSSCLLIMTPLAKRLPVSPIPEQCLVATVRNDVVDDRCLYVVAVSFALLTQWVCLQELSAGLLPLTSIATTRCRSFFLRVQRPVCLTVFLPRRHQCRTAWMPAWHFGFRRHRHHLHSKSPGFLRSFIIFWPVYTISYVLTVFLCFLLLF